MNKLNENSHCTAIERTSLSYPARVVLYQNKMLGDVLDYGCGIGKDVELLTEKKYNIEGYDPFYFPKKPLKKYDTILCFYVLNVLMPEEQNDVLIEISKLMKPTGKAYFAVRRDVLYEGFRMHKLHKKETYQCNVVLPFQSIFKNENCEIYEFQHYTSVNDGQVDISPFFNFTEKSELILENKSVFAVYDKFPVSKGHALIVPKKLVSSYFDLNFDEQMECWKIVNKVKEILIEKYNPDGFNIGINVNEAAGQTINHCHIHIIPRYKNDVENPRGGIRGVIPSKKEY